MKAMKHVMPGLLSVSSMFLVACSDSTAPAEPARAPFTGDYAGFVAAAPDHKLVPGDTIVETNNWGGYYFALAKGVTSTRISITGAGGSAGGAGAGGTGGTGEFDLLPSFLSAQSATGFWVVLGEAGRASAGETTIANFVAFNGGGAATDWSHAENTYDKAAGGGGGSDVRLVYAGDQSDPHAIVDACADPESRFAVVGGGGGGTDNGTGGGAGGGFNNAGGDGVDSDGSGATISAGGSIGGALCRGGNGLQDGSEGWAGGGGGGYYGGGAAAAHVGGGGGSGYLMTATGLNQVTTADGAQAANSATDRNGAFMITTH